MTLEEWIPRDLDPRSLPKSQRSQIISMLDVEIVEKHSNVMLDTEEELNEFFRNVPFDHKYVHSWVELENGYAVGFNENPSRGWSLPIKKLDKSTNDQ